MADLANYLWQNSTVLRIEVGNRYQTDLWYTCAMNKQPANTNAERQARWRAHNPESHKKAIKAYWDKNHVEVRERARSNRAKREGRAWEIYTELQVIDEYGEDCYLCLKPIDFNAPRAIGAIGWALSLHIDHVVPVSKGGGDILANVRPTHAWCNASKHDKILIKSLSKEP